MRAAAGGGITTTQRRRGAATPAPDCVRAFEHLRSPGDRAAACGCLSCLPCSPPSAHSCDIASCDPRCCWRPTAPCASRAPLTRPRGSTGSAASGSGRRPRHDRSLRLCVICERASPEVPVCADALPILAVASRRQAACRVAAPPGSRPHEPVVHPIPSVRRRRSCPPSRGCKDRIASAHTKGLPNR